MEAGHYDKPYILISDMGDNWGLLSTEVKDRTNMWGDLENSLKGCGETLQSLTKWLDDSNLLKLVVSQHLHPGLAGHKKIMQVPIGIPGDFQIETLEPFFRTLFEGRHLKNVHRTRLLNRKSASGVSGLKHRATMDALLKQQFPIVSPTNTTAQEEVPTDEVTTMCCGPALKFCEGFFHGYQKDCVKYVSYLDQMFQSKFVLTLSGVGYDTWRHTEALYAGAIPVFEHGNGALNGTYHDLPVLMVDDYANLTPAFLEAEYSKIMASLDSYNWARFSSKWYVDQVMASSVCGGELRGEH
jgi:hypothetical protein